jgi:hypothetical protein
MNSRPLRPAIAALALGVICALAAPVATASADSAVISAVDAGGGQMHVTAEVTSTSCSTYGYCGWFSFAVERHSSLPCVDDEAFLMGVHSGLETAGTVKEEWNYEPFFPRLDKICVFVDNGAGTHPVGEAIISLPPGYGRQYSTAHNCSYFASQRRAEYYLELYPSDPSGLDADHDGSACEDNRCPCGAEAIPPEPVPAPSPPTVVIPTTVAPAAPTPECVLARERKAYWGRQVSKDQVNVRYSSGARERRYWARKRNLAEGRLRADKAWVVAACA